MDHSPDEERRVVFEVPGPPVPKARPRIFHDRRLDGKTRVYTPSKTKAYEHTVRVAAIAALARWRAKSGQRWIGSGRFGVSVFLYVPEPSARSDIDNQAKSILDGCSKVLFDDDRLVDVLHLDRYVDPLRPRAIVSVFALEGES